MVYVITTNCRALSVMWLPPTVGHYQLMSLPLTVGPCQLILLAKERILLKAGRERATISAVSVSF